jgi:hypothetical protein
MTRPASLPIRRKPANLTQVRFARKSCQHLAEAVCRTARATPTARVKVTVTVMATVTQMVRATAMGMVSAKETDSA